jgi:hypothetical protein
MMSFSHWNQTLLCPMYIWNWLVFEINTADSVYKRLMTKIKSVSLDHSGGCPILSEDTFIFSRTKTSKIFGKKACYSCTYLIIITSEIIFIVFFLKFFFKPFLRNKIDPMPLSFKILKFKSQGILIEIWSSRCIETILVAFSIPYYFDLSNSVLQYW